VKLLRTFLRELELARCFLLSRAVTVRKFLTHYDEKNKPPYPFSTHIGAACAKQFRTFPDLAKKLKMDITELMRLCNGKVTPSEALVKGMRRN
jgi:hypothetical protein